MLKRITLLGTVFAAGFAMSAGATPVKVEWDGVNIDSATTGGPFNVTLTEGPVGSPTISQILAWCLEIGQAIRPNQNRHYVSETTVAGYNAVNTTGTNSGPGFEMTDAKQGELQDLFAYYNGLTGTDDYGSGVTVNTAMQVAIWKAIGYSTLPGSSGVDPTELGVGNTFLADAIAAAGGGSWRVTYLVADGVDPTRLDQDLIYAEQVPLPAGVVLMLGGLGAFAAVRRRQKRAA